MFPEPLDESPIAVLEFVQTKELPTGLLLKLATCIVSQLHSSTSARATIKGVGLMLMVKLSVSPVQPWRLEV
jgi:hypothetical protein